MMSMVSKTKCIFMPHVTIYTTPSCVFCRMAKDFFQAHSVAYEEKNAAIDVQAREELVQKSGQMGVPVIDIDGRIIVGFDEPALREALGMPAQDESNA